MKIFDMTDADKVAVANKLSLIAAQIAGGWFASDDTERFSEQSVLERAIEILNETRRRCGLPAIIFIA